MRNKKIFLIHDFDGKPYYSALEKIANITYLNSRPFRFLIRDIVKHKKISRQTLDSLIFFFKLPFCKNQKIILAMAPFNFRLFIYFYLTKKNTVYYHTSWPFWIEGRTPFSYSSKFLMSYIVEFWKNAVPDMRNISVTKAAKKSLQLFANIENVTQIYHAVDLNIIEEEKIASKFNRKDVHFVYLGRLEEQKGIDTFIYLANKLKRSKEYNFMFHIIGKGTFNLKKYQSLPNLKYYGFLNNRDDILKVLESSHFLLSPGKRSIQWEELFGISIIEAMSQGVIPITTDHIGPVEIIANNTGMVLKEENYIEEIISLMSDKSFELNNYLKIALYARESVKKFSLENISKEWKFVLNEDYSS